MKKMSNNNKTKTESWAFLLRTSDFRPVGSEELVWPKIF